MGFWSVACVALIFCELSQCSSLNFTNRIVILKKLSLDYFGSSNVIFLESNINQAMTGNVKEASRSGFLASTLDIATFLQVNNIEIIPKPIVVASVEEVSLSSFSEMTKHVKMSRFHWIFFSKRGTSDFTFFHIPYNTKFVLVTEEVKEAILQELYRVTRQSSLKTNLIGHWDFNSDIQILATPFYVRRMNFNGVQLNYLTPEIDSCPRQSFKAGNVILCIHEQIWKITIEALNATTQPVFLPWSRFPLYAAQKFSDEQEHMALHPSFMTSLSTLLVHFFWPTFKTEFEVYTQYSGNEISWDLFLKPFSRNLWIAVLCWISCCCSVILLARKYILQKKVKSSRDEQIWYPVYAFLSQGTTEPAIRAWERFILLSAFLAPSVLLPAYSAALTSFFAVQIPDYPYTDLGEMREFPNYKLVATKDYDLHSFLKNNHDETSQYLLNHATLSVNKSPATDLEGVLRMCKEPLSFISTKFSITALKPKCKYYALSKKFVVFHQSMTMPRNSPYENVFNLIMRNLRFSGLLQTLKINVTRREIFDLFLDEEKGSRHEVKLDNVLLLLLLLLFVSGTSIIILICEIYIYRFQREKIMASELRHFIL